MGESLESNFNFTELMSKELDKIEQKGESVTKFVNATGSSRTIGSLTGGILDCLKKFLLNTITLLFPLEIYIIHTTQREFFLPNAKPIFGILKANGYKTVLFLGSDSNFS